MPPPTRRSGRKRKANIKYLGTGWDKDTLRLLRESSESSGSSPSEDSTKEVEIVDQDFAGQVIADAQAAISTEDEDGSDASNGAAIRTPNGSDEDSASFTSHEADTPRRKGRHHSSSATVGDSPRGVDSRRSRGIAPAYRRSSRYSQIFGPDDDLKPLLHARDTWLQDHDKSLPSRRTLSAIQPIPPEAADLLGDLAVGDDDISIAAKQELELIDIASEQAARYLIPDAARQSVALGPVGQQKLATAEYLRPLDVSKTWSEATTPQVPDNNVDAELIPPTSFLAGNKGWIINIGEKIQSVAWLPGIHEDVQLLAVACRSTSQQRTAVDVPSTIRSTAFHPSASYPSCLQLWAFHTSHNREGAELTSPASRLPELYIAYALDAGDIRQLQWQPSTTVKHLKLLAVLSTDGSVRLLALNPAYLGGKPPACIRVKTAPMQIQPPPDTVFTTMCWASTLDLILGASDGTIRIFNVQDHTNPTPYLCLSLHNTYIMNIVSTFPSSTPTFIASTSAAGDLMLTDLRAPDQDSVCVPKARLPTKPLIYLPHTRSFITVTDTTGISEPRHTASVVQRHDLRHFYQSRQICKLPAMSGAATALAGSAHHPCILIGNAKGSVFATNYLRRVLPIESGTREWDGYLQTVYEYDWRPMTAAERQANSDANGDVRRIEEAKEDTDHASAPETIDLFHGPNVRPGISRFTEDFLPEPIDMNTKGPNTPKRKRKHSQPHPKQKKDKTADEAARYGSDVIFEEEQAVTCIEWNPNPRFAGWAAVGWGSGILRVQDLSHDGE